MKNFLATAILTLSTVTAYAAEPVDPSTLPTKPMCGDKDIIINMMKRAHAVPISKSEVGVPPVKERALVTNRFGAFWIIEVYKNAPKKMCILGYVSPPNSIKIMFKKAQSLSFDDL